MMHAHEDSQWPVLDELVERVVCARRQIAVAQAAEAKMLCEAVELIADRTAQLRQEAQQAGRRYDSSADLPLREVSLELGMAMRMSDRTVQARMSDAFTLVKEFPRTLEAWSAGDIDAGHAWGISRVGILLTDEDLRARYEDLALAAAATESPARMTQAAKAIAATLCPEAFAELARAAADERTVRLYELPEGMARIIADLPAPLAHAVVDRLTEMARAVLRETDTGPVDAEAAPVEPDAAAGDSTRAADAPADAATIEPEATEHDATTGPGDAAETGEAPEHDAATETLVTGPSSRTRRCVPGADPRRMDQIRADVFCDLLLTGAPTAHGTDGALASVRAQVQITVPALTLAGDDHGGPALLAGYGPIDPALARRIAGLAPGWDRVFADRHTGEPLAVDRYRPSAQLKRYLAARDERCRAPECTRPVYRADIDHTIPASQGGTTCDGNLGNFCRRHHICKHHTAWRVRQLGHGVLEWTAPTGRRYLDRPPAVVRFVPAREDPPPF
ncbi:MAG: HNH endonuclease [Microbacterium hominis]|jgi:hypothetical protein|uniref:HNH endonuclease signature motif containing protein n=1 Tax=Microbacterium TaxID=33882 RepID=UPI00248D64A5|nr:MULTISPECIES: HNH endonuclease signature motif containing protein [Microbacterium]MBZ6371577.1 HNH endonuclease [Microbacterium hominis]